MDDIVLISISRDELCQLVKEAVKEELKRKSEKQFISFKEVCEWLNISPSTLNSWKSKNMIPYMKIGKKLLFNKQEISEALKNSRYYKTLTLKN